MKYWWEIWPERLRYELEELDDARIPYKRDDEAFAKGKLILRLRPTVEGQEVGLVAEFPDLYPYFRLELIAPDLNLSHHQNPFLKNLCLIDRNTASWSIWDTLAGFVKDRLPQVLNAARTGEATQAAELEVHQGEPVGDYYDYTVPGAILIDSEWVIDPATKDGELAVGIDIGFDAAPRTITGAVFEVRGPKGVVLARTDPRITKLFPSVVWGKWVRLDNPILGHRAEDFKARLFARRPDLAEGRFFRGTNERQVDVIAVIFPEELAWRKNADGWAFLVRTRSGGRGTRFVQGTYLVRAARAGCADLSLRIPELKGMGDKRVAIFGLGCVGAPSALEFARAGVGELRLVDFDYAEAGAVVRWPLGITAAGMPKVEALREFILSNYPYTNIRPYIHQIGGVLGKRRSDLDVLDEALKDIDLVYDATAELGIQYFLSELAKERGIPYLCISTTPGGWGGLVARFLPGRTKGCWSCLQLATSDGTISSPPADPNELIQPAGCAAPTFTGAGFDVGHVSLAGVRVAVATLCAEDGEGYPDFDWDVGVLFLRNPDAKATAPRWETFQLVRHPSCEVCKKRQ